MLRFKKVRLLRVNRSEWCLVYWLYASINNLYCCWNMLNRKIKAMGKELRTIIMYSRVLWNMLSCLCA